MKEVKKRIDTQLQQKFRQVQWMYADKDPTARAELARRIIEAARKQRLLTYSELVRGVIFRLPNIRNGEPYQIHVYDWTGLDRRIIGEFLGYLSMESFEEGGFLVSALVVGKQENEPSIIFFEWMRELGVLPDLKQDTRDAFWVEQVSKAHAWYQAHPPKP